jgi:NAD(P)H-hydrate epimerase
MVPMVPIVIDARRAQRIGAVARRYLRGLSEFPIIITPHPGEMARLTGLTTAQVLDDRVTVAREFAIAHGVITVLKANRSLDCITIGGGLHQLHR